MERGIELQGIARSARAAAHATSAKMRSDRCSACKARGVTLRRLRAVWCWPAAARPTNGPRAAIGTIGKARPPESCPKRGNCTAATVEEDIAWAARQGTNDRKAGTECRKYENFLRTYNLPRSQFTLRMCGAYLPARQPTQPAPPICHRQSPSRSRAGLVALPSPTRQLLVENRTKIRPRRTA